MLINLTVKIRSNKTTTNPSTINTDTIIKNPCRISLKNLIIDTGNGGSYRAVTIIEVKTNSSYQLVNVKL